MSASETRVYTLVVCERCGVPLGDHGDEFTHPLPSCPSFRAKVLEVVPRSALIAAQEEMADADYHAQALAQGVGDV